MKSALLNSSSSPLSLAFSTVLSISVELIECSRLVDFATRIAACCRSAMTLSSDGKSFCSLVLLQSSSDSAKLMNPKALEQFSFLALWYLHFQAVLYELLEFNCDCSLIFD